MKNSFVRNSFVVSPKGAKSSEGSSMNGSNYDYDYDKAPGGRWLSRDANEERSSYNLFAYVKEASLSDYDILGLGTKVVYSPLSIACSCGEAITIPCDLSRTPHVKQGFKRGRKVLRLKVTVTWDDHTVTNTGMSPTGNMVSWESSYTDNYRFVAEPDVVADTSDNCC